MDGHRWSGRLLAVLATITLAAGCATGTTTPEPRATPPTSTAAPAAATPPPSPVAANEWPFVRSSCPGASGQPLLLVALGTSVAYLYSGVAAFLPSLVTAEGLVVHLYFETSAAIIVLVLLGRYFESRARGKTSEAVKKLIGLAPKTASSSVMIAALSRASRRDRPGRA